jgi:TNF receptor-associated protein 1
MINRSGTYELREDNTVEDGTKIVIQLKEDCKNFSDEEEIKGANNKYSFFFFLI